jgi:hypothetical protein
VDAVYKEFKEIRAQNLDRSRLAPPLARRTLALPIGVDFHSLDHPRGVAKLPGFLEQVVGFLFCFLGALALMPNASI